MNFLASFLAKLAQPLIEKIALAVVEKIKEYQRERASEQIEKAARLLEDAKTDEERMNAAREAARAIRSL